VNLMMVGGMVVLRSFWFSLWMLTVSKALLRSKETRTVRFGGCFWLKPSMMVSVMLWSAVVVEWRALKPC